MRSGAKFIDFDQLRLARRPTRDASSHLRSKRNFKGHMSQFIFNGNNFFEMVRTGGIDNVRTNAQINKRDTHIKSPITFLSPAAYLITKLKLYSTFSIFFYMKTTQEDGLTMYSGAGVGKDFLAIELVNGHVRFIYDVGSGPRVVKSKTKQSLNDNEWHEISVLRPTLNQVALKVDDTVAFDHLPNFSSVHFDMGDNFFIGGLTREEFSALPKQVRSREGFLGCLASLDLDGNKNIMEHRATIPEEFREEVFRGCEGESMPTLPPPSRLGPVSFLPLFKVFWALCSKPLLFFNLSACMVDQRCHLGV
jgi:leucine-rich repeat transmembrane neuronal protein 1/2